jgi:hypothetical protein
MRSRVSRYGAAALGSASLALAMSALAQPPASAQSSPWRSFVSVSPVFEEADLDSGGQLDISGVILRAGTSRDIDGGNRAGITLNYDYFDYSFDDPVAFGGVAPWDEVQRYGFSLPLSLAMRDGWTIGVTPSFDWFREDGAKSSESLVWGGTVSGVKRFPNGNLLGLGVGGFDGLEDTKFFPFPIVSWRLSKRWQLVNPLAAGPTGPAGLELDYLFDNGWSLGLGAAYRSTRFRLDETGPTPDGIGEITGVPVFLRATNTFANAYTLNLYAGVVADGKLRVEDSSGNKLREEDFDLAPLVGFNLTARF